MDKRKRKQQNKKLRDASNMQAKRHASREVLGNMPEMRPVAFKVQTCDRSRPCNHSFCDYCSGAKRDKSIKPTSHRQAKPVIRKSVGRGGKRNFRRRGGEWLSNPFQKKNLNAVFPITLNLCVVALGGDGKNTARRERQRLRDICKKEFPNAVIRLQFDVVAKPIGDIASEILNDPLHHTCAEPVVLMFHAHGFIFEPTFSTSKIRQVLQRYYPGSKRVCISKHIPISYDEHGRERGGLAGFGEYASMEKTELDFPDDVAAFDNVAVLEALIKFRHHWPRQARRFAFGDRKKSATTKEASSPHSTIVSEHCQTPRKHHGLPQNRAYRAPFATCVRNNYLSDLIVAYTNNIWVIIVRLKSYLCGEICRKKPP